MKVLIKRLKTDYKWFYRGKCVSKHYFQIFYNDRKIGFVRMIGLENVQIVISDDEMINNCWAPEIRKKILKNQESILYCVRKKTIKIF